MTPPKSFIRIANQAGLYDALWRPETIAREAGQLISPLRAGRNLLLQSPWFWERFGDHAAFLEIVEQRLAECEQEPGRLLGQERVKQVGDP
jgi:hypothetical protein